MVTSEERRRSYNYNIRSTVWFSSQHLSYHESRFWMLSMRNWVIDDVHVINNDNGYAMRMLITNRRVIGKTYVIFIFYDDSTLTWPPWWWWWRRRRRPTMMMMMMMIIIIIITITITITIIIIIIIIFIIISAIVIMTGCYKSQSLSWNVASIIIKIYDHAGDNAQFACLECVDLVRIHCN